MERIDFSENKGSVNLCGIVKSAAIKVGENKAGEAIYEFVISCYRLSGIEDLIICRFCRMGFLPKPGERLLARGEICSTRKSRNDEPKLHIYVWVLEMQKASENFEDCNLINVDGILCKRPVFRKTPRGKKVADFMIATDGRFFSSYIPCIAWGSMAYLIANAPVGTRTTISARLQSRTYEKKFENGGLKEYTVRELSVLNFESIRIIGEGDPH